MSISVFRELLPDHWADNAHLKTWPEEFSSPSNKTFLKIDLDLLKLKKYYTFNVSYLTSYFHIIFNYSDRGTYTHFPVFSAIKTHMTYSQVNKNLGTKYW